MPRKNIASATLSKQIWKLEYFGWRHPWGKTFLWEILPVNLCHNTSGTLNNFWRRHLWGEDVFVGNIASKTLFVHVSLINFWSLLFCKLFCVVVSNIWAELGYSDIPADSIYFSKSYFLKQKVAFFSPI